MNVFGKLANSSGRGYMSSLPGEALKPRTWKKIISKRYIGFIITKVAVTTGIDGYVINVSTKKKKQVIQTPTSIYLQATILFFVWLISGYFFGKQELKLHSSIIS